MTSRTPASFVHEISGGRFRFGIGVSHGPAHQRLGVKPGKPLEDIRKFVADLREGAKTAGDLPPVVLATLRQRMVALAAEIAQGAVWANAARSHMAASLRHLPEATAEGPRLLHRQHGADGGVRRSCRRCGSESQDPRQLRQAPNYQNYWIGGGLRGGDAGHPQGHRARARTTASPR